MATAAHSPLSMPISVRLNVSDINTSCCNGSESASNCCKDSGCCRTRIDPQNVKVVAAGPNRVGVDIPPGCCATFCDVLYEIFCGRCEPSGEEVDRFTEGKRLYHQSLVDRLGPSGVRVAYNYIDQPHLLKNPHLTLEDAQKLERAIHSLQGHMANLDKMVSCFRLIAAKEYAHNDIPRVRVPIDQAMKVSVSKSGAFENFQEEQLRDDLTNLPLNRPLDAGQVDQIVQGVKGAILAKQADRVDSAFIRIVVAQELIHLGIDIVKDSKRIAIGPPSKDLLGAIHEKRLASLSGEELRALLALAPSLQDCAALPRQISAPPSPFASGVNQMASV